ncbi:polysaccharide biosynthesis tyrosine autokinase [Streptomyces sp. 6N223]|uniref:polysaccharide biosynthesis tyrosine autokinase n=1 Tax=Streptomyces sp. 6N223 TaxID=3457412 RepID=UPI003FD1BF7E
MLDHLPALLRRWRAIVVLATLGTALAALATSVAVPQYRATATLFVSLQNTEDTIMLNEGNSFAQARVRSYAEAVSSPKVTEPVVESLDLDMTPAQLGGIISTEVPLDTVLLRITATDTEPSRAARISNAIADRFTTVIAEIERPVGAESSPVRLSVVEPAAVPSAPSSPSLRLNLALGLLAGLALGVGFAVARESRDSSVRSRRDLTDSLAGSLPEGGAPPVLGSIPYDARASDHPVAGRDNAFGPRAEAFRRLRTSLRFLDVDRTPKIIAVTSALPGEGKSSISVNLAAALSELGTSVCLVDADLRRPCLARTLGLVQDAGLTTVMIGQAELRDVLQSTDSFSALTSGAIPPNPAEMLASAQFCGVLRELADSFDHVVVDTPPVLPLADVPAMAPALDGYLLVVRYARTRRGQAADAVRALRSTRTAVLGSILNVTPAKGESDYYGYGYAPSQGAQRRLPLRLPGGLRQRRSPAEGDREPPGPADPQSEPTRLG